MAMESKKSKHYIKMIIHYFYYSFRLDITDFTFVISWRIKASINIAITGLQIEMYLGDLKMNFDNLMEEERINSFIHDLVNEMGVELLGDIWDYGQTPVVNKVEEVWFLQSHLKKKSTFSFFFLCSLSIITYLIF